MAEILSLSFDDGWIERTINNDPSRVIRWNPGDPNFLDRFLVFQSYAETLNDKLKAIKGLEEAELDDNGFPVGGAEEYEQGSFERLAAEFNAELDKAFGSPVSAAAFGITSPISPTPSGKFIYENFLDAITPIIEGSFSNFAAAREKYTAASRNRAARRAKK